MVKKAQKQSEEENRPLLALARIVAEAYEGERNAFDQLAEVDEEGEESIEPSTDSGSDLTDMIVWELSGVYEHGLSKKELIERAISGFSDSRDVLSKIILSLQTALENEK